MAFPCLTWLLASLWIAPDPVVLSAVGVKNDQGNISSCSQQGEKGELKLLFLRFCIRFEISARGPSERRYHRIMGTMDVGETPVLATGSPWWGLATVFIAGAGTMLVFLVGRQCWRLWLLSRATRQSFFLTDPPSRLILKYWSGQLLDLACDAKDALGPVLSQGLLPFAGKIDSPERLLYVCNILLEMHHTTGRDGPQLAANGFARVPRWIAATPLDEIAQTIRYLGDEALPFLRHGLPLLESEIKVVPPDDPTDNTAAVAQFVRLIGNLTRGMAPAAREAFHHGMNSIYDQHRGRQGGGQVLHDYLDAIREVVIAANDVNMDLAAAAAVITRRHGPTQLLIHFSHMLRALSDQEGSGANDRHELRDVNWSDAFVRYGIPLLLTYADDPPGFGRFGTALALIVRSGSRKLPHAIDVWVHRLRQAFPGDMKIQEPQRWEKALCRLRGLLRAPYTERIENTGPYGEDYSYDQTLDPDAGAREGVDRALAALAHEGSVFASVRHVTSDRTLPGAHPYYKLPAVVSDFLGFLAAHDLADAVLVGGVPRDLLLNLPPRDLDFTFVIPANDKDLEFGQDRRQWNQVLMPRVEDGLSRACRAFEVTIDDLLGGRATWGGYRIDYVGPYARARIAGEGMVVASSSRAGAVILGHDMSFASCSPNVTANSLGLKSDLAWAGEFAGFADIDRRVLRLTGPNRRLDFKHVLRFLLLKHRLGFVVHDGLRKTINQYARDALASPNTIDDELELVRQSELEVRELSDLVLEAIIQNDFRELGLIPLIRGAMHGSSESFRGAVERLID